MIKYTSIISARIQNHIMYGIKLIANSEIKLSRKKNRNEIATINIPNINNIQSFYLFKLFYF
jgi:hypothetical protein